MVKGWTKFPNGTRVDRICHTEILNSNNRYDEQWCCINSGVLSFLVSKCGIKYSKVTAAGAIFQCAIDKF